jgi:hypothetical protein
MTLFCLKGAEKLLACGLKTEKKHYFGFIYCIQLHLPSERIFVLIETSPDLNEVPHILSYNIHDAQARLNEEILYGIIQKNWTEMI